MFDHVVLVTGNVHNVRLLKSMGLTFGRDFRSEKGAVAAGRPHQMLLRFRDTNQAILFKLRATS